MTARDPMQALRAQLEPDEELVWSDRPGPIAAGAAERRFALFFAGVTGLIVAILGGVEGLGWRPLLALVLAVSLTAGLGLTLLNRRTGRRPRAYAISNRRLLIFDDGELLSFRPGEVPRFEVDVHPDTTVDLVWGRRVQRRGDHHRTRSEHPRSDHRIRTRTGKVGFVGLASAEPAQALLQEWMRRHEGEAAAPALPAPGTAARTGGGAGESAAGATDWRTLREPASGLAIDLPGAWQARVGRIRRHEFLGLRFESPEPVWLDAPEAGWNRLELRPGLEGALLQVDLDPGSMPESLEAVVGDRWAKVTGSKAIETRPHLSFGGLSGFAVTRSLAGSGPVGAATRTDVAVRIELTQTQFWLRGAGASVQVVLLTPPDAAALRDALERVVATLRLEHR